jgi:NADPH-dependent ferric siderophore reductase
MTNITVTHAPSGLVHAEVLRSERISPNFVRVTIGGSDVRRFEAQGFDQWFRLALPVDDGTALEKLPQRVDTRGYLKYLMVPKTTRPVIRNYTVREFRPEVAELDIDFVVHGTDGVAGPWATSVEAGAPVAFIDQGRGWKPVPAESYLLVADETGLPAIAGVLRDMPRDAVGHAVIEISDAADAQDVAAPNGINVHWVVRARERPGTLALATAQSLEIVGTPYVFVVGESALATGLRRWAVAQRGIPKTHVTFCGYWRLSAAH